MYKNMENNKNIELKINRKEFIKLAIVLSSIGIAYKFNKKALQEKFQEYPKITKNSIKLKKNNKKVLIVGAGISGLMTACELLDKGFSVDIIEKKSTAGGKLTSWKDISFGDIDNAKHAVWNYYNNFKEFLGRHNIKINQNIVNNPYGIFSVGNQFGEIVDYHTDKNDLTLFHNLKIKKIINETLSENKKLDSKKLLKLMSFDSNNQKEVKELDEISMYKWSKNNGFSDEFIQKFIDPLLNMTNFTSSKEASALAWFRHTSSHFGSWEDMNKVKFFSTDAYKNIIKPIIKYITSNGGKISFNTPIEKLNIKNNQVKYIKSRALKSDEYICPICGHIHKKRVNKCERCGYIGNNFIAINKDSKKFSADYYLFALDIHGMKKIIKNNKNMQTQFFDKIKSLSMTTPTIVYFKYKKNNKFSLKKNIKREVIFGSGFSNIGTIINHAYKNGEPEILEIQISIDKIKKNLKNDELIKNVQKDLKKLFPELPEIENYRVFKWDNYTSGLVGDESNRPEIKTPFENLFLMGDYVKIKQNCLYMEKTSVVSKTTVNHVLKKENIEQANLKILPSETPNKLLEVIREFNNVI